jgi:hypothetical protein
VFPTKEETVRRIIIVGVLVVVLAAAFVIPAVAQTPGIADIGPWRALSNGVLVPVFGFSSPDDPTITDSATNPDPNESSSNSSSVNSSEDPARVSSSSDPSSTSSSSTDPAIDPPGVSQEFSERRITSGAASPSSSFSNTGNNVNACATTQQVVNTGNVANQQGVSQYNTTTDDIDFSGSEISITPSVTATCDQTLNQAAGG